MLRFILIFGLLVSVSCGGDDGPPGSISGDGCEECGEFEAVLESICSGIDRCPDFVYPIGYRSQGECVAILAWATTCMVDDDGQDVDEAAPETFVRRIPQLSDEEAQACADYIDAASCDELNALMQGRAEDTPCFGLGNAGDVLSGSGDDDDQRVEVDSRKREGEQCNGGHEDCRDGLFCHHASSVIEETHTYQCPTCLVRPKLGEPCRPYYEPCVDGLRCLQEDGMTGYDYYGVCAVLADNGEPCTDAHECVSEFCNRKDTTSQDKTCQDGGREGQSCGSGGRCVSGFVCVGPEGARVCTAIKKNGEACTYTQECSSRVCDPDGKCGIATGSEESCRLSGGLCRSGYCSEATGQCAETVGLGAPCEDDTHCGEGVCGRQSNRCIEDFCQSDADCSNTQYCGSYAECIDRRAEGSNCFSDEECLSNYCNSDDRCGMETTMGGACQSNSQCYPWGACENGMCVPLKDPGESCVGIESCKPPFICQNGRCELINISCVPAKVGQPCASLRVCEADATCDFVNGIVCKPRGGEGENCIRPTDCHLEFYCARSRTCEPRPTAGQSCDSDMPCAEGHNCIYDEQSNESTCAAAPVGDYCDTENPCPEAYRCEGSRCAPPLELGDACQPYNVDECPDGTYCSDESSTCIAAPSKGASCTSQIPCADGYHCNQTLMQCVDDLSPGAACDYPGAKCMDGYGCVPDDLQNSQGAKSCRKLKASGESCVTSLECLTGVCLTECQSEGCLTSLCVEPMCIPPGG